LGRFVVVNKGATPFVDYSCASHKPVEFSTSIDSGQVI